MSKKKRTLPRGEYRARWGMVHKDPKAYDRKRDKKAVERDAMESLDEDEEDYIECELIPMQEHLCLGEKSDEDVKTRLGRYHGSAWGFGAEAYPIAAWIKLDYTPYIEAGLTPESILNKCVNFLNKKPYRKRKSLYGKLIGRKVELKDGEKGKYLSVIFTTDLPKSKHFWGKGKKSP